MSQLKSLLGLIVSLSLLFFAPASQAKDMVSVDRATVNMRSGASTRHSILWALSKGYPLEVTRRQGNWLKVRDFENDTGWIYRPVVTKTPYVIVKASVANVRSAPSTGSRILGKDGYGDVLRMVEHRSKWIKVQRESGVKGWISRALVWGW